MPRSLLRGSSLRVGPLAGSSQLAESCVRALRCQFGLFGEYTVAGMVACDMPHFCGRVPVVPTTIKPPAGDLMDLFTLTARA